MFSNRKGLINLDKAKTQKYYKIQGVDLYFPYELYEAQINLVSSIITALHKNHNGLFHSPTGTGKTLCFLISVLSYMNKHPEKEIKFFYCTRTHSQMNEIMNELKKSCYEPKVSTLGSRDILCVDSSLDNLKGQLKNLACKTKECSYYKNLEENQLYIESSVPRIIDLEDLYQLAQNFADEKNDIQGFCPYYYCRKSFESKPDLIILTYNYLLDSQIRRALKFDLKNSVLLFDEAHNIEEICENILSFSIKMTRLELIFDAFQNIHNELPAKSEFISDIDSIMCEIEFFIKKLKKAIPSNKASRVYRGEELMEIISGSFTDSIIFLSERKKTDKLLARLDRKKEKKLLLKFMKMMYKIVYVKRFLDYKSEFMQAYCLTLEYIFKKKQKPLDINLSLYCFDPTAVLHNLITNQVKSLFLTSGTLTPFEVYDLRIRVPFETRLSNPHAVDPQKSVRASIVKSSIHNERFDFSMKNRNNKAMILQLGESLLNIFDQIPNGKLVFFTSFRYMQEVLNLWKTPEFCHIFGRMEEKSAIFIEERSKDQQRKKRKGSEDDDEDLEIDEEEEEDEIGRKKMNDFYKKFFAEAKKPNGAVLFGVLRGKGSEGINFSDESARGVFIIGIPFPPHPKSNLKIGLKMEYLNLLKEKNPEKAISGQSWYQLQAVKSINQGIGRILRHRNDYGVVALFDHRCSQPFIRENLSDWAKEVLEFDTFDSFRKKVKRFFETRKIDDLICKRDEAFFEKKKAFRRIFDYSQEKSKMRIIENEINHGEDFFDAIDQMIELDLIDKFVEEERKEAEISKN